MLLLLEKIYMKKYKISPDKWQEISCLYTDRKFSMREIAELYKVSLCTIRDILNRLKIPRRNDSDSHKKYSVNEDFFTNIDSEEKAYFLGLLVSDGNVYGNQTTLGLQAQDGYILELFKLAINYSGIVYFKKRSKERYKDTSCITISSKKLTQDLSKYGVVPCKSSITVFPDIPENLHRHFIRGVFDGDGCISVFNHTNKKKKWYKSYIEKVFTITGSKELISSIQATLILNCKLNKTKLHICNNNPDIRIISYSGKLQIDRIKKYLYEDATIFLKRKKDKFYDEQTISENSH